MSATPTWPASEPVCFGVGCPRHGECARWHAVDGASDPAIVFMGYCGPERAAFLPIQAPAAAEIPV